MTILSSVRLSVSRLFNRGKPMFQCSRFGFPADALQLIARLATGLNERVLTQSKEHNNDLLHCELLADAVSFAPEHPLVYFFPYVQTKGPLSRLSKF